MEHTVWGNLNDLVLATGLARRTLQYMAKQEPGVLITRERGRKTEYDIGACNVNLRKREVAKIEAERKKEEDGDESMASAEKRKAIAEATIAELKLATAQRAVVPIEDHLREIDNTLLHLRAVLIAHPKTREIAHELLAAIRDEPPAALESADADASAAA